MDRKTTEFIIYIIHEIANSKNEAPSKIYKVLENTGCIQEYLVPFYDVLHTMSSESVIDDVKEFIEARGVVI
ncbi:MAG: DUF3791 domain-containing protein [Ruminococcus sp.]|nr:DUF3791 domain-containing protein [Ruminococcus sp.]